ncbi:MAG: YkgJ family cysteine cluster protein [Candidatus Woesearchaeota archaeon]
MKLGSECKRCGHCCTMGTGYVLKEEVGKLAEGLGEGEFIKKYLDEVLRFNKRLFRLKAKNGSCVFFDKICTIQANKPLHCRISTCAGSGDEIQQWFFANHVVDPYDPTSLREWNLHVRLRGTIPGANPGELFPDKAKLRKILGYKIIR